MKRRGNGTHVHWQNKEGAIIKYDTKLVVGNSR